MEVLNATQIGHKEIGSPSHPRRIVVTTQLKQGYWEYRSNNSQQDRAGEEHTTICFAMTGREIQRAMDRDR